MSANAWNKHPRLIKTVKPHSRVDKEGNVQFIDSFQHQYPHKFENAVNRLVPKKEGEKLLVRRDKKAGEVKSRAKCMLGFGK